MTQRTRRNRIVGLLCGICTGAALLITAIPPDQLRLSEYFLRWELGAKDVLVANFSKLQPDPRLAFIGIDQPTYADVLTPDDLIANPVLASTTNTFPWSRELWAAVIDRLAAAGARTIILDLVFATPGKGDEALRQSLDRHRDRVVIGANFLGGNRRGGNANTLVLPTESVLVPTNPGGAWNDSRLGFVNVYPDLDDVVRRATFKVQGESGLPPNAAMFSLAARALQQFGASNTIPGDTDTHLFRFSGEPGVGYKPIPLYEILLPNYWTNNFQAGAFFRDKIVMVGPAANVFHDEHRTPYPGGAMLGPEIHLNILGAALRGEFLGETSRAANLLSIALGGGVALVLALIVSNPIRRLLVAAFCVGCFLLLWWALFRFSNYYLLAVTPILAGSTGTLAAFTYDFVVVKRERNRNRRTFERYVSKDVVRELLDNPGTFLNSLGGVRKPVAILFSDVRGFTTLTEAADPAQLVTQLNEYLKEMVAIVFAHQGSLDKFIGDAVMAVWGNITSQGSERDARNAVAAALAMRKSLARLNVNWRQRGWPELSFGIGVNHGDAIVGNLGSDEKMEVSAIGDPVNLASRLEGLTKEYKLDLLLGESMRPLVKDRFVLRTVGSVQVKGKTKAVRLFTVAADREAGEEPPVWLARYEEGVELYRNRAFASSAEALAECLRQQPDDSLSQLYLDASRRFIAEPPGPEWDTVRIMKTK